MEEAEVRMGLNAACPIQQSVASRKADMMLQGGVGIVFGERNGGFTGCGEGFGCTCAVLDVGSGMTHKRVAWRQDFM